MINMRHTSNGKLCVETRFSSWEMSETTSMSVGWFLMLWRCVVIVFQTKIAFMSNMIVEELIVE